MSPHVVPHTGLLSLPERRMMALATISDVEARLGRPLTVEETAKASAWLEDATALFVRRAVQKFEFGSSTVRLLPRRGVIRLVQSPVVAITTVEDLDGNPVAFNWDGFSTIYNLSTTGPLKITYQHGSNMIPQAVVAVVAGMVARTLSIGADAAAGVTQQTVGPFSQSYATWAVGGQVMLSPAEQNVADSYAQKFVGNADLLGNGYGINYSN